MPMTYRVSLASALALLLAASFAQAAEKPLRYVGVSLSGAEFGPAPVPGKVGVPNKDYTYPTDAEIDYFLGKGMTVLRVAFLWERLRPTIDGPLDEAEFKRLDHVVKRITAGGGVALLDPHNYARYFGKPVGSKEVPAEALASLWSLLADEYKTDDRVWLGLMNEPHDMPSQDWLAAANASIAAIRKTGAKNLILVPGNSWTGAHSWTHSDNGKVMLEIVDPLDHYVFEVHQYLDQDSSGQHPEIVNRTIGIERLKSFTEWCRKNKRRGFLGEFAAASHEDGHAAIEAMVGYMEANADVWTGWCWWAAGPWWNDYMFSIEPKDGKDAPQLAWLTGHFPKSAGK